MKLLFKPLALVFGVVAARVAKTVFQSMWSRIDDREPPKPTTEEATFQKVVLASVLRTGTEAAAAAASERAAARTFEYLFGVWPGEKRSED